MHEDLVSALNEIEDPELGIGIVDLGLVYRAEWSANGIEVDFTTTTPTCPFGDTLLALIDELLRRRFREAASIRVRLVRRSGLDPGAAQRRRPAEARLGAEPGADTLRVRLSPRRLEELANDFLSVIRRSRAHASRNGALCCLNAVYTFSAASGAPAVERARRRGRASSRDRRRRAAAAVSDRAR